MTIYRPRFVAQWNDPTSTLDWYNCTMASGAMGLDFDTLGQTQVMGGTLRTASGDTTGGSNLIDLARGWAHYGQTLHIGTGGTWNDALAALKESRGIVLQGMYGALPRAYRTTLNSLAFTGSHAVYVNPEFDASGDLLMGDPLNDHFLWVPQAALAAFANALGARDLGVSSPQKIFFASSDPHVPAPQKVDLMIIKTHLKAEDWKPTLRTDQYKTNGVFRAHPLRTDPIIDRAAPTEIVRSVAEITTDDPVNSDWRQTRRNGADAFMLWSGKTDWTPVVQGGDPATDAELTDLIDRKTSSVGPLQTVTITGRDLKSVGP